MNKIKLNMIIAFITKFMLIVAGIVSQRFVLKSFGSEINGLTSSISQFLSYFALLEAGLGLASIQALYKPLAEKNKERIESILAATAVQYRRIGVLFLLLTIVLSLFMPFLTHSSLNNSLIFVLTLIMGLGSVINYLFIGRYQVLLNADHKVYVINTLDSVLGIVFRIINIIMINMGFNVITVYAVGILSPVVRLTTLKIYFKKNYPNLSYKAKPDFASTNKKKYVFVHQIVGMITSHTDIVILTVFSTLSHVSVYSVYNFIYENIRMLVTATFQSAVEPAFGKLVGSGNKNIDQYHRWYELLITFFMSWLYSTALIMTMPFIKLYTSGVKDINYVDPVLAILFMTFTFFMSIRIPALMLINTNGAFKETQRGAIIQAVLNIVVSLISFYFIGMRGLLLGTVVSSFYRMIDVELYAHKYILKQNLYDWLKLVCINITGMVLFAIVFMVLKPICASGWISWLLEGIKSAIIGIIYFSIIFIIFYKNDFMKIIKSIKRNI